MREKLLTAVQEAVVEIASTMLFLEVTPTGQGNCGASGDVDISAIVGLSGGVEGSVRLSGPKSSALKLSSGLMGEELSTLDATAQDGFAELANMTAGGLQTRMCGEMGEINLSPPVVVTGHQHSVRGESKESCGRQDFEVEGLHFFVEVLYINK